MYVYVAFVTLISCTVLSVKKKEEIEMSTADIVYFQSNTIVNRETYCWWDTSTMYRNTRCFNAFLTGTH